MIQKFTTLQDYCSAINIPNAIREDFDIRSFQDNMATVVSQMPAFRHEFYAIALKIEGGGKAVTGQYESFLEGATVFFNSPFQITSWDIVPDWEGYYIMFTKEFLAKSRYLQRLLDDFPFLKIDKSIPFQIDKAEASNLLRLFKDIKDEYEKELDSFPILEAQTLLLLNYVKRYFNAQVSLEDAKEAIRKTDVALLSRFQTLIETHFQSDFVPNKGNTHSPSYYAHQLGIHPNHLNTIVKGITQHTAKQLIFRHLLRLSKTRLRQTNMSVKEIAYSLHFDSPNNFSSFFKKQTQITPNSYRNKVNL